MNANTTKLLALSAATLLYAGTVCAALNITPYTWEFPQVTGITGADDLKTELQENIDQVLTNGHLAPIYISRSDQQNVGYAAYLEPGRIITTLAWAYPHVTASQQTSIKSYVASELADSRFAPWASYPMPKNVGTPRELHPRTTWWYENANFGQYRPSVQTIYGLWLYGYRSGDWNLISNNWSTIKTTYSSRSGQANLYGTMCAHVAMARLADKFADSATRTTATNNLQAQLNAGLNFSQIESNACCLPQAWNAPYADMYDARMVGSTYRGWMFLNLTPELGRYLHDNVQSATLTRHNSGKATFPFWWVAQANYFNRSWTGDEGTGLVPDVIGMLAPVERWVVQASSSTLRSQVKSSPTDRGDCYWLEALVQAIEAHGTYTWADVRSPQPPGDTTPPAAVTNLSVSSVTSSSATLLWVSPGDDGNTGTATSYDVRYSTALIDNTSWTSANQATGEPAPAAAGNSQSFTVNGLAANTTYYFALKTADEAGNISPLSNVPSRATSNAPPAAPSALTATAVSSSQINLAWTDNANNETGFKIERKTGVGGTYAQIATVGANVTTYNNTGLSPSTTYYYRVRSTNSAGDSAFSNEANATTQSGGGPLPSPWLNQDIGSVGATGSATYTNGTFTVKGNGADIWDQSDAFQYVYQSWTNDVEVIARVVSVQNTDGWAKAGVMVRETLAANSKHAMMILSPSFGTSFQRRTNTASLSSHTTPGDGVVAPCWVRLVRSGSTLTGYKSTNGTAWVQAGSDTISMSSAIFVGMPVTAHTNGVLNTSTFDSVTVSAPGSGLPAAPSNLAATAVSSTQINLAWTDNANNETGFKIERKTGAGGTYAQIATVAANVTSYNNTGLSAGTSYYYRVRSTNSVGDSAYSNEANATTPSGSPVGLAFNGTSSKAVAADSASLDINGSATTMEAWIFLNGPDTWTYMQAVGRQVISTDTGWTRWHGIGGYSNGQEWKFGLVIGPTYYEARATSLLPRNQWVHVAGSYDGATVRFFVNGTLAASTAATGTLTVNNNSWSIGSNGSGEWFQGNIDEVRISNNARYTANFTVPSAAFSSDANTKALWHMNENTGTTSADASGNNNTLTLTSTTWTTGKF